MITWISHPIKNISAALTALSNSGCVFICVQTGFGYLKKGAMFVITSDIYLGGRPSLRMQNVSLDFPKGSSDGDRERR